MLFDIHAYEAGSFLNDSICVVYTGACFLQFDKHQMIKLLVMHDTDIIYRLYHV